MRIKNSFFFLIFGVALKASLSFDVQDPNTLSTYGGSTNNVFRRAEIRLSKTATTYTLTLDDGVRSAQANAAIVNNQLADLQLKPRVVVKTHAQVNSDKRLQGAFTVTATPNPEAIGGYQVFLQVLDMQINFIQLASHYLRYQTNASSNDQTQLLYFDILNNTQDANTWYMSNEAALLSQNWNTNQFFSVKNSFGSQKTTTQSLTISIPAETLAVIPEGVYIFPITMIMLPFSTLTFTQELTAYNAIVDLQTDAFSGQLLQFRATKTNQNFLHTFTTEETAQLDANEKKLIKAFRNFLQQVKKQYQSFAKNTSATTAQVGLINARIAAINVILTQL